MLILRFIWVKCLIHGRVLNAQIGNLFSVCLGATFLFAETAGIEHLEVVEFLQPIFLFGRHLVAPFALFILDVALFIVLIH